jgi:hypothetical protein
MKYKCNCQFVCKGNKTANTICNACLYHIRNMAFEKYRIRISELQKLLLEISMLNIPIEEQWQILCKHFDIKFNAKKGIWELNLK